MQRALWKSWYTWVTYFCRVKRVTRPVTVRDLGGDCRPPIYWTWTKLGLDVLTDCIRRWYWTAGISYCTISVPATESECISEKHWLTWLQIPLFNPYSTSHLGVERNICRSRVVIGLYARSDNYILGLIGNTRLRLAGCTPSRVHTV